MSFRRSLRILFHLANLIAIALIGTLWVRSYGGTDCVSRLYVHWEGLKMTTGGSSLCSSRGGVGASRGWEIATFDSEGYAGITRRNNQGESLRWDCYRQKWVRYPYPMDSPIAHKAGGFAYQSLAWGGGGRGYTTRAYSVDAVVPYWSLVVPLLVFPGLRLRAFLRRRRLMRQGKCVNCGYDLRASVDRCPECGLTIKRTSRERGRS